MSGSTTSLAGSLLAVIGILFTIWSLFIRGRSRGRRRCPKCWYDMRGNAQSLTCPECGFVAERERQFTRTRRYYRWALLGLLTLAAGGALYSYPRYKDGGWRALIPSTVLILALPFDNNAWVCHEIGNRVRPGMFGAQSASAAYPGLPLVSGSAPVFGSQLPPAARQQIEWDLAGWQLELLRSTAASACKTNHSDKLRDDAFRLLVSVCESDDKALGETLMRWLDDENANYQTRAMVEIAANQPTWPSVDQILLKITPFFELRSEPIRRDAAAAIAAYGASAAAAVPDLRRFLAEEHSASSPVIDALLAIGPPARDTAPRMLEIMIESSGSAPRFQTPRIALLKPDVSRIESQVRRALVSPRVECRHGAIELVSDFGRNDQLRFLPEITEMIGMPGHISVLEGVRLLGRLGPDAIDAVPALETVVMTDHPVITSYAIESMVKIGADDRETIDTILRIFDRAQYDQSRGAVARSIPELDISNEEKVRVLLKALDDPDGWVRREALYALERLGPDARPALPMILELCKSPHAGDRAIAREAAAAIVRSLNH